MLNDFLTSHMYCNVSVRERVDSENSDQYQILEICFTWHFHVLHPREPRSGVFSSHISGVQQRMCSNSGYHLNVGEDQKRTSGVLFILRVMLILNLSKRKQFAVLIVVGGKVVYKYSFIKKITLKVNNI